MKDYSNFTKNDVIDIRGLSDEQIKYILDLNPMNRFSVDGAKLNEYYRPLAFEACCSYIKEARALNYTIHPASDFLPQENPMFKRGDLIKVWNVNEMNAEERIGLVFIEGAEGPVICVVKEHEENFRNNKPFVTMGWKHCKPITENPRIKEIEQQITELQKELETIKD